MCAYYTIDHVIQECISEKTNASNKRTATAGAKQEIFSESWNALIQWIESRLGRRRGASVPMLGTFTWEFKRKNGEVQFRPIFILADSFLKEHLVKKYRVHKSPIIAPSEEVNFSTLAIKFSKSLTKDMAFAGVRDIMRKIGQYVDRVYEFEIDFQFGVLKSKERKIKFEFNQGRITQILPQDMSTNLYSPEDYMYDDEPDQGTGDFSSTAPGTTKKPPSLNLSFRPSTAQSNYSDASARSDNSGRFDQSWKSDGGPGGGGGGGSRGGSSRGGRPAPLKPSLSAVRLAPLPEATDSGYGYGGDSAALNSTSAQNYDDRYFNSPSDSREDGSYSAPASSTAAADASLTGTFSGGGHPIKTYGHSNDFGPLKTPSALVMTSNETEMSPRLQELIMTLEAREAQKGLHKLTSNGRFAREKVIEQAYIRCLQDAHGHANYEDQMNAAEEEAMNAWARRDQQKRDQMKNDAIQLRKTLDQQLEQTKERLKEERLDRVNAYMASILPESAGSFSLPFEGPGGGEMSMSQRREHFCQELAQQIKTKADRRARSKEQKMMEEREYLDHIAVELDMQSAVERANHLEKQQTLLEAWERDAHIRNLKKLQTSGVPAVQSYIQVNLPQASNTFGTSGGMASMGIGFDSRRARK